MVSFWLSLLLLPHLALVFLSLALSRKMPTGKKQAQNLVNLPNVNLPFVTFHIASNERRLQTRAIIYL